MTEFSIVATFNGLAPQFACHLCKRAHSWMPLIVKNTIQGDGMKKTFYVWLDYSQETQNAYSVLQLNMVPAWFIFNEDGKVPQLADVISAQAFNEKFPIYDALNVIGNVAQI